MTVGLGGLDALVFTGGVGENAAEVRRRATDRLAHLGVLVDDALNAAARPDTDISGPGGAVRTLVVASHEALEIADGVEHALVAGLPPVGAAGR